jgi:hypothetical protein
MATLDGRLGPPSPDNSQVQGPGIEPTKLDARLGQRITDLQSQIAQAQAVPDKTMGNELTSTEGLIKLGLAIASGIAGAATGSNELGGLGYGLLSGTVQGAGQWAADDNAKKDKQIADMQKQLATKQEQITRIAVSQPGLLLDDQGNNAIPEDTLGMLIGIDIPINPHALYAAGRKGEVMQQNFATARDLMTMGAQQGNRTMFLKGLKLANDAGGWNFPEQTLEEMADLDITDMIGRVYQMFDPQSVFEILKKSHRESKPFMHYIDELKVRNPVEDPYASYDDQRKGRIIQAENKLAVWIAGTTRYPPDAANPKGREISNQEIYNMNRDEALKLCFDGDPVGYGTIREHYKEAYGMDDDLAKARTTAMFQAIGALAEVKTFQANLLNLTPGSKEYNEEVTKLAAFIYANGQASSGLYHVVEQQDAAISAGVTINGAISEQGYTPPSAPHIAGLNVMSRALTYANQAVGPAMSWPDLTPEQREAFYAKAQSEYINDVIAEQERAKAEAAAAAQRAQEEAEEARRNREARKPFLDTKF